MINIKCQGCNNNCCVNPHLTPVLLPSEEQRFNDYSIVVETPYRNMRVLAKKANGSCLFLDDKIKCSIYDERPFECKLYPFLLDFDFGLGVKLDKRFCQSLSTLNFDKDKISALLREQEFSEDWIKGYVSLEDC